MAWDFAKDVDNAATTHDFALLAAWLYRCLYLHDQFPYSRIRYVTRPRVRS
jgi:hypothetical protein